MIMNKKAPIQFFVKHTKRSTIYTGTKLQIYDSYHLNNKKFLYKLSSIIKFKTFFFFNLNVNVNSNSPMATLYKAL